MIYWFCLLGLGFVQLADGISPDWPRVCPEIISKTRWLARRSHAVEYVIIPVKNVIIHHTVSDACENEKGCAEILRGIQNFHVDEMEFHDIGYNFMIGGDGNVYEGVGWHRVGAHTRGYNTRSIGIALIGNFSDQLPSEKMLQALRNLLACGVELGELDKNYKLFGARQVSGTLSPGTRFYTELQQWPHFTRTP